MADPYLILAGASALMSFSASRSAAKAAQREAALKRRQLQQQIEGAQLAALQDHNRRMRQLAVFLGTNEALSGISGRDMGSDRSFNAIQEKAKKETATEVDRKFLDQLQTQAQLSLSKNIATEQGNNLAKAYEYQAFGTLFSSALQAKPLMPNPSTGTKSVLSPQFRRVGYGNTSGVYT